MVEPGIVKNRLAQGLAGDGPPLDTAAAEGMGTIDDDNPFAKLGSLDGRLLPRWTRPNDC